MAPQHRQTPRIEQQSSPATGAGRARSPRCARRAPPSLAAATAGGRALRIVLCSGRRPSAGSAGQGDLLVLAQNVEFRLREAELDVGDGGGKGRG